MGERRGGCRFTQNLMTRPLSKGPSRLLKNSWKCHPEVVPILRDRRICFIFSVRKQQILRFAQDDTLGEEFFSSLLTLASIQKRTHAEVDEQESEKSGNRRTPGSDLARRISMILRQQSMPPAKPSQRNREPVISSQRTLPTRRSVNKSYRFPPKPLKNPPAFLPSLKRPGHFAQHGADRARRWKAWPAENWEDRSQKDSNSLAKVS